MFGLARHLGFLRTFPEITMLISMTKFFFNNSFEVVIPDCQEWVGEGPCFDDNSILWFTDGSKKDSRVEVGVRGLDFGLSETVGAYPGLSI